MIEINLLPGGGNKRRRTSGTGTAAFNPRAWFAGIGEKITDKYLLGGVGAAALSIAIIAVLFISQATRASSLEEAEMKAVKDSTQFSAVLNAKSKAEAASASVRDAAGTYLQLQKDKRDDRIAANKALLDQATAQVTLDKAKSDLALSKVQANAAAATTEAELQQALVSAQLQLLRDQQRLDAVRTGTATSSEVEPEGLSTQEQLLIQRLKILKLEKEISEQKARNLSATAP